MSLAPLFVIALRVLGPISIFWNKFFGISISILLDLFDLPILGALGNPDLFWRIGYHKIDKVLDIYYLSFFFFLSLKWKEKLPRRVCAFLFSYRLIGVLGFLLSSKRYFLVLCPNLFENFFLFYLIAKSISPAFKLEKISQLCLVLLIVGIPKIFQEYITHYLELTPAEFLKNFTPFYFEQSTITEWLKTKFFTH